MRENAGFFRPGLSNFSSIQTLLGDFINDRNSPSLLKDLHNEKSKFLALNKWSIGEPCERVIENNSDLENLLSKPHIFKNSICIIEPADHVGRNLANEDVRASNNIACLCQYIAAAIPFYCLCGK